MTDLRIFNLDDGLTPINVAKGVEGFFIDNKSLASEIIETPNGIIIQARPNEESSWKKYVGMDNTIQVHIYDHKTSIIVIVGFGKWIDKAVAGTLGWFVFSPLAVTATIGAYINVKLPKEVLDYIEMFIKTGGKDVVQRMRVSDALKDNEIFCPKCRARNPDNVKFCSACGEKLALECECGATLKQDTKFCGDCGKEAQ
ncbi:MAG: zinc ribbon domain-containing protein [Methanobacteriaceae archaeon]